MTIVCPFCNRNVYVDKWLALEKWVQSTQFPITDALKNLLLEKMKELENEPLQKMQELEENWSCYEKCRHV